MKKKFLLIALAVAICIPTVVAIVSYNTTNSEPVSGKNVRQMTLSDLDGETFSFSRDENGDMIDFFLQMNDASTKVSSLPDPLLGTPFFKITMLSSKNQESFQYYFSKDTTEAYYQDGDGITYKIPPSYATEFTSGKYAASLYEHAKAPSLLVSGQDALAPSTATWSFKNAAGSYVAADVTVATGEHSLSLAGGLSLSFSMEPDFCQVKLTDKDTGEIVFDDTYENIGNLSLDKNASLSAEITAKWFEDAIRDCYGEMKYTFSAAFTAPAGFALGRTEIQNGEFTVVSAKNVANPAEIAFSSSPDIGFTPVFIEDGGVTLALIAIRQELSPGTYTLSFNYGGITEELDLTVTARPSRKYTYQIDTATLNATRTDATIAEFQTATAAAASSYESTKLWEGTFLEAVTQVGQYDGVITLGFGHERTISANKVKYLHEGVDYATSKNREIRAANNGKVIFAGFTALGGNTVIIEHGYGLKTWYSHLSEMKVAVGDTIERGATVGLAGKTGFTNQNGVHAGMTVFDVPVSPYPTWDEEIPIVP